MSKILLLVLREPTLVEETESSREIIVETVIDILTHCQLYSFRPGKKKKKERERERRKGKGVGGEEKKGKYKNYKLCPLLFSLITHPEVNLIQKI